MKKPILNILIFCIPKRHRVVQVLPRPILSLHDQHVCLNITEKTHIKYRVGRKSSPGFLRNFLFHDRKSLKVFKLITWMLQDMEVLKYS